MEQLTLEQAAKSYSASGYYRDREETFKAGAAWQKEQYRIKACQLLGLEVWIADAAMKKKFQDYLHELLQD